MLKNIIDKNNKNYCKVYKNNKLIWEKSNQESNIEGYIICYSDAMSTIVYDNNLNKLSTNSERILAIYPTNFNYFFVKKYGNSPYLYFAYIDDNGNLIIKDNKLLYGTTKSFKFFDIYSTGDRLYFTDNYTKFDHIKYIDLIDIDLINNSNYDQEYTSKEADMIYLTNDTGDSITVESATYSDNYNVFSNNNSIVICNGGDGSKNIYEFNMDGSIKYIYKAPFNNCKSVFKSSNGDTFLTSYSGISNLTKNINATDKGDNVIRLAEDKNGNIINGSYILDTNLNKISTIGMSSNRAIRINDEKILIGSQTNGIGIYNSTTNTLEKKITDPDFSWVRCEYIKKV